MSSAIRPDGPVAAASQRADDDPDVDEEQQGHDPVPPPDAAQTESPGRDEDEDENADDDEPEPTPDDATTSAMEATGRTAWHIPGRGPVPTAEGPVRQRWRKIAGRTLSKAWGDSLFGLSSQAAFWSALSTAPILIALLGLIGPVANLFGPDTLSAIHDEITKFLNSVFNPEVANNLLGNTVATILNSDQSGAISAGLVIALWAGSSAMSAFIEAITIAYGQHEVRHPVKERFFALGLYLIALLAGIVLLPPLAIGPDYLPRLFPASWRDEVGTIVNLSYYPVLGIAMILLLTTLYKVAPRHKHTWRRGLPGALLAALVFLVASFFLRLYLSYVYAHGLTYGALATPITFLLFYYFSSMAIIIGAQFNNATLEYYPPKWHEPPAKRKTPPTEMETAPTDPEAAAEERDAISTPTST